jgi:hypothetical protein
MTMSTHRPIPTMVTVLSNKDPESAVDRIGEATAVVLPFVAGTDRSYVCNDILGHWEYYRCNHQTQICLYTCMCVPNVYIRYES